MTCVSTTLQAPTYIRAYYLSIQYVSIIMLAAIIFYTITYYSHTTITVVGYVNLMHISTIFYS